jgi:hypothetical protein
MSYVNCFIEVWNETRRVSVGGRSANNSGGVRINTATAVGERDCKLTADVVGNMRSKDRKWVCLDGDNRKAIFDIELPEPGGCEVRIGGHHEGLRHLAQAGCFLVALQGVDMLAKGDEEGGKTRLDFSRETLAQLEAEATENLPHVTLPGGVTLAHALACVALVGNTLPKEE